MTRLELLTLALARARSHGFPLRRWYTSQLGLPWIGPEAAIKLLEQQRRYYALLFSHEFAKAFWKAGEEITFEVPATSYQRTHADGSVTTVRRKAFMRRSSRRDAWRFHLREMAVAEDPLRYLLRYFKSGSKVTLDDKEANPKKRTPAQKPAKGAAKSIRRTPRPLPDGLPAFLQRPFDTHRRSLP